MLTNWNTIQNSIKRLKTRGTTPKREYRIYKKRNSKIRKEKENFKDLFWHNRNEKLRSNFYIDTNIETTVAEAKKQVSIIGILIQILILLE